MKEDIERVLITEEEIRERLDHLAKEITEDSADRQLTVVGILNGSCLFLGDLLRRIPLPLTVDCISVASYHGGTSSSGHVTFRQTQLPEVNGRDVLLVDDILDTGRTIQAVRQALTGAGARSVKSCVLVRKAVKRVDTVGADYVGFDIGSEFVVGYGLDYMGHYRNLPFIGVLHPDAVQRWIQGA
ncbi:MAG: hypoxanthine phosphoribosyltransferase [Terrimicrobiaceae bacterium]